MPSFCAGVAILTLVGSLSVDLWQARAPDVALLRALFLTVLSAEASFWWWRWLRLPTSLEPSKPGPAQPPIPGRA